MYLKPVSPELLQTSTVQINLLLVDLPPWWLVVQLIPVCQIISHLSIQFSISYILLTTHI